MSTPQDPNSIRIEVSKDARRAALCIPGSFPRRMLTRDFCLAAMDAAGVRRTPQADLAIESLLKSPPKEGEPAEITLVNAVDPRDGVDGSIEWLVDAPAQKQTSPSDRVNHYQQSAYVVVRRDQVLGRLIAPLPGEDGHDVMGKVLPAKAGRMPEQALHETILCRSDGQLIAQQQGVLIRSATDARITEKLHITGHVDFSTGNIDFPGDIVVDRGIKDLFEVRAGGSIQVGDVIEAATIECGGDLIARRGMAGREQGNVRIGGNFHVRYLGNVRGVVEKDLIVDSETLNSELTIYGNMIAPSGTLSGGGLTVVGRVELCILGSDAGTSTELILGTVPRLEERLLQLQAILQRLTEMRDKMDAERAVLEKNSRRMPAEHKTRLMELGFELQRIGGMMAGALSCRQSLETTIEKTRTVDLTVHQCIHPGVCLKVRQVAHRVKGLVQGPLKLSWDGREAVCRRQGSDPVSLIRLLREAAA